MDGLEDRGFDFYVAAAVKIGAQRFHDPGAQPHHITGGRAGDEVEVAHPHPRFFVEGNVFAGFVLVNLRQRAQGLGGHLPFVGENGEFAALGGPHVPGNENEIAQVYVLFVGGQPFFAHVREGENHLEAVAAPVLEGGESNFSAGAGEHDTPGDTHRRLG